MKILNKTLLAVSALIATIIISCDKKDQLASYEKGNNVTLTASATTLTPALADSSKPVVTFSWTSPNYSTDTSNYKFIIEIDSTNRNFAKTSSKTVTGVFSVSLTGTELNTFLLNYGFTLGTPYVLDVRVVSSYGNNNERYFSNTVKLTVTPYSHPATLASEKTSVVGTSPTSTNHSNTFTWSDAFPGYSGTINYIIQYDSAGKNFANPKQIAGYGGNGIHIADLNQGDMNSTALASGIAIAATGKVDYRVKATTAGGAISYSNTVSVSITTFSPVPANLFIVGDATLGGWANPVPVPSQKFTKVDDYKFSLNLWLNGGKSYLFLPVNNGDWSRKYGGVGANNSNNPAGDDFKADGSDMKAPASDGVYQIVVDFQTNKFTVTAIPVPANLFIVGDATPGGWSNPVPTPSQQFTPIDNVSYGIVINLTAGKSYLFLPVNGDWSHKYGGATNGTASGGGVLLADGAVPGSNTPAPSTSGLYLIVVNFATNSYTVTPYTGPSNLYIVGDATAGGWNNPVPTPSQQITQTGNAEFQLTISLTSGKSYLFLPVNGDWSHKFGGSTDGTSSSGGILLADGAVPGSNTPAPASSGTYTIKVNFITMRYKVQ